MADLSSPVVITPYEVTYLNELQAEKEKLNNDICVRTAQLLNSEIERCEKGEIYLDSYNLKASRIKAKILIPQKQFSKVNLVGKLLGRGGTIVKQLSSESGCKLSILGRGSITDKRKEEELRNSGGPKNEHLNEELHILIETVASPIQGFQKLAHAIELITSRFNEEPEEMLPAPPPQHQHIHPPPHPHPPPPGPILHTPRVPLLHHPRPAVRPPVRHPQPYMPHAHAVRPRAPVAYVAPAHAPIPASVHPSLPYNPHAPHPAPTYAHSTYEDPYAPHPQPYQSEPYYADYAEPAPEPLAPSPYANGYSSLAPSYGKAHQTYRAPEVRPQPYPRPAAAPISHVRGARF